MGCAWGFDWKLSPGFRERGAGMRIYNRRAFALGMFCAFASFALGILRADWWQWAAAAALSGRCFYSSLSKEENERTETVRRRYRETAVKLYGRYAWVRLNLPWILLVGFFVPALFIRLAFDLTTPVGAAIGFCVFLTVSVLYSVGADRAVKDAIEKEMEQKP